MKMLEKSISWPFPSPRPRRLGSQLSCQGGPQPVGTVPGFTCSCLADTPSGQQMASGVLAMVQQDVEISVSQGLLAGNDRGPNLLAKWLCG